MKKYSFMIMLFVLLMGCTNSLWAQYHKILVIGNSITQHAPVTGADGLVWEGNDFVHRLQAMIQADQPEVEVELQWAHITDEKTTFCGYNPSGATSEGSGLDLTQSGADLIVFQLGDNYKGDYTYDALQKPYEDMINAIAAGNSGAVVAVTSTFWTIAERTACIEAAANNTGSIYVPIYQLNADVENRAYSEEYAPDSWLPGGASKGVGVHPGDTGMLAIATEIYNSIPHYYTPEPATMSLLAVGGLALLRRRK
jgi:hypothetical protein